MFKHQLQKNFILNFVQKLKTDPYIGRSNTFRIEFQFAKIKLISSVDKVDLFFLLFFYFLL